MYGLPARWPLASRGREAAERSKLGRVLWGKDTWTSNDDAINTIIQRTNKKL